MSPKCFGDVQEYVQVSLGANPTGSLLEHLNKLSGKPVSIPVNVKSWANHDQKKHGTFIRPLIKLEQLQALK